VVKSESPRSKIIVRKSHFCVLR